MIFSMRLSIPYSFFQYVFGFLDELPVQIYSIRRHSPLGIVFAKDEVRGLFIILIHFGAMIFSFL